MRYTTERKKRTSGLKGGSRGGEGGVDEPDSLGCADASALQTSARLGGTEGSCATLIKRNEAERAAVLAGVCWSGNDDAHKSVRHGLLVASRVDAECMGGHQHCAYADGRGAAACQRCAACRPHCLATACIYIGELKERIRT